jgi:CheY-like chemotaxis protein
MTKTRILIVEDEFITATDIQSSLVAMGYDVPAIVDNGEEAIRKAGELRPSLVLMDIGLSGRMNGIEAAKQIRERFDIPVIILTAHTDESTFWTAIASEPYGYIFKPFVTREMKIGIEMALHKHGKTHSIYKVSKKLPLMVLLFCVVLFTAFLVNPLGFHIPGSPGPSASLPETVNPVLSTPATPAGETLYEKNVEIVKGIAQEYHSTHTYLGVQTGQSSDMYVCIDMAKDVWNMVKTRGINAVIEVGNVKTDITSINDADHAWVLAEAGPMQWLAVETTGGFVVTKDENPRYYTGLQFETPADMKAYSCGQDYCWSHTCVNGQCQACNAGFVLGTDLQCHPGCGSAYCTGNSACVNGQCVECTSGTVLGTDNRCHPTCIDATHYCLSGFVCGTDNKCHAA